MKVYLGCQGGIGHEFLEQSQPRGVGGLCETATVASLPAVTVGSRTGLLEHTVVATVTGVGTLRAATQRICQTTTSTHKDILHNIQKEN